MQIGICDDNAAHTDELIRMIRRWRSYHQIEGNDFIYEEADLFWASQREDAIFDLVFIDINLPDMNGMKLAEKIRAQDPYIDIVFLTDNLNYAVRGYEVGALAYIMKPIDFPTCVKLLDNARAAYEIRKAEVFMLLEEAQKVRVLYRDIFYIEVFLHNIVVHATDGEYRIRCDLKRVEDTLPKPAFFRCHRSFIVNMRYVRSISRTQITLEDENELPVARARRKELYRVFADYNENRYGNVWNIEAVRARMK